VRLEREQLGGDVEGVVRREGVSRAGTKLVNDRQQLATSTRDGRATDIAPKHSPVNAGESADSPVLQEGLRSARRQIGDSLSAGVIRVHHRVRGEIEGDARAVGGTHILDLDTGEETTVLGHDQGDLQHGRAAGVGATLEGRALAGGKLVNNRNHRLVAGDGRATDIAPKGVPVVARGDGTDPTRLQQGKGAAGANGEGFRNGRVGVHHGVRGKGHIHSSGRGGGIRDLETRRETTIRRHEKRDSHGRALAIRIGGEPVISDHLLIVAGVQLHHRSDYRLVAGDGRATHKAGTESATAFGAGLVDIHCRRILVKRGGRAGFEGRNVERGLSPRNTRLIVNGDVGVRRSGVLHIEEGVETTVIAHEQREVEGRATRVETTSGVEVLEAARGQVRDGGNGLVGGDHHGAIERRQAAHPRCVADGEVGLGTANRDRDVGAGANRIASRLVNEVQAEVDHRATDVLNLHTRGVGETAGALGVRSRGRPEDEGESHSYRQHTI